MAISSGKLDSISMLDLIEEACLLPKSYTINLSSNRLKGIIVIKNGRVVHAQSSDKRGEEALFELLALKDGDFVLEEQAFVFQKTIHRDWKELLEHCDEELDKPEFKENPESMGVEPTVRMKPSGEASELDEVFQKIPGVLLSVELNANREVLDRSGLGNTDSAREMAAFLGPVTGELNKILKMGEARKIAIKGSHVLFFQQRMRESTVAVFFDSKSSAGKAYRSMDDAVKRLEEKRGA